MKAYAQTVGKSRIGDFWKLVPLAVMLMAAYLTIPSSYAATHKATAASHEMQPPIPNPFLADSTAQSMHGGSGHGRFSPVAGIPDVRRPLTKDEITWIPTGPANWTIMYSGPYPNGQRVAWTGTGKELFKLDAETLKPLASIAMREGHLWSAQEVTDFINKLDGMNGYEYYKLAIETELPERAIGAPSAYKIVSNENEVYVLVNVNRKTILRVYGDVDKNNPASPIELKREWPLPKVTEVDPAGFAVNMTYDGRVVVITMDGTVYSVSRDLKSWDYVVLPGGGKGPLSSADKGLYTSTAFVRNAAPIDPDGGIYVVTQTDMNRVQWTGEKLSFKPEDGAWSVPYAGGALGSGTSPAIVGWGKNEDQLVVTGDGRPNGKMHMWAFWRNKIPADWKGIKGLDRRVAGLAPVDYGKYTPKWGTIENTPTVKGYGIFEANDEAVAGPDFPGGRDIELTARYFSLNKEPQFVPRGGIKYNWNPKTRKFELAWKTDMSFATTIPVVDIDDTLYTVSIRNGVYTMEAVDWNTGKSKFHYKLGTSLRFNTYGGSLFVAPNGALDCACNGGAGIVRINPRH